MKALKEIIIFLLLLLAVILILGLLLYDYIPANKIVPEKVSYSTPETVKNELQTDDNIDGELPDYTYSMDSSELSNYKKTQELTTGRKNPFGGIEEDPNTTNEDGTSTGTGSSSSSTSGTTSSGAKSGTSASGSRTTGGSSSAGTSGNNYLPNKGTK